MDNNHQLIADVEGALERAQNNLNALAGSKSWIEQAGYAKQVLKAQQAIINELWVVIKGALQNAG